MEQSALTGVSDDEQLEEVVVVLAGHLGALWVCRCTRLSAGGDGPGF